MDIANQDDKYEHYFDRFRIGTEYRLDAVRDKLGIAFRGGLAAARPTAGLGVNIYNIVQLDAAYAFDPFFNEYAWYGYLGWRQPTYVQPQVEKPRHSKTGLLLFRAVLFGIHYICTNSPFRDRPPPSRGCMAPDVLPSKAGDGRTSSPGVCLHRV